MIKNLISIFFILHGLVHLLYFGQAARYFELRPDMVWPEGSWAFSKLLGNPTSRGLASILLILTTIGFVTGGMGLFAQQVWWRPLIVASAVLSIFVYILFWDGVMHNLDDKGLIAILINAIILVAVLISG